MFTDGADILCIDGIVGADILGTVGIFGVSDAALGADGINELTVGIAGAFTLGMFGTVIPLMVKVLLRPDQPPTHHQL